VTALSAASVMSWPATLVRAFHLPNTPGTIELHSDRIAFGEHSIERAGARLALVPWCDPMYRTTLGAALHVQTATSAFWIGGHDYLLPAADFAQATKRVHVRLSCADFQAFVRALEPALLPQRAPHQALSIELRPSSSSIESLRRSMGPWLIAVLVMLTCAGLECLLLPMVSLDTVIPISLAVVAAVGLFFSIRNSLRPSQARYRLLVDGSHVALIDTRSESAGSAAQPNAEPLTCRASGRVTFECPAVRLRWPGRTLVVGPWNSSFTWQVPATQSGGPSHFIGPEEWRCLLRALALG
jgi:hypothetical protein